MKASEIDWSNAPKGATHWDSGTDKVPASWMKLEAGDWFFWSTYTGVIGGWVPCGDGKGISSRAVRRPEIAAWNGTSLPPVGTVCEMLDGRDNYVPCTVVAHVMSKGRAQGIAQCSTDWFCGGVGDFRPLRTPEQIAAEERDEAIHSMWMCIYEETPQHTTLLKSACADLYDAGYRKVEGDKQ